jgi:hypothetical protein
MQLRLKHDLSDERMCGHVVVGNEVALTVTPREGKYANRTFNVKVAYEFMIR